MTSTNKNKTQQKQQKILPPPPPEPITKALCQPTPLVPSNIPTGTTPHCNTLHYATLCYTVLRYVVLLWGLVNDIVIIPPEQEFSWEIEAYNPAFLLMCASKTI